MFGSLILDWMNGECTVGNLNYKILDERYNVGVQVLEEYLVFVAKTGNTVSCIIIPPQMFLIPLIPCPIVPKLFLFLL